MVDLTSSPPQPVRSVRDASPFLNKASGLEAGAGAPKRMFVKNFKVTRKADPRVFFEQTWAKVDAALDTVFARGDINFSLEELYRGIENLCRQGMAKEALRKLVEKCEGYIKGGLAEGVKESVREGKADTDVLRRVLGAWAVWGEQVVSSVIRCGR